MELKTGWYRVECLTDGKHFCMWHKDGNFYSDEGCDAESLITPVAAADVGKVEPLYPASVLEELDYAYQDHAEICALKISHGVQQPKISDMIKVRGKLHDVRISLGLDKTDRARFMRRHGLSEEDMRGGERHDVE